MQIVRTEQDVSGSATAGCAFVPTMGALHDGHCALIRKARSLAGPGRLVVISIFVNPTQFGPNEDFARYPRMLDKDVSAAADAGADVVFAPDVEVMYPSGRTIAVPELPAVATQPNLEDAVRPGHFSGVCQVVARLFDLIKPGLAVFGEKDYQQLQVIRAMVDQADHRWPGLHIVPLATVREKDGLAMSSRNMYLQPSERHRALGLWNALTAARDRARNGITDPATIEQVMVNTLHEHQLNIDYAVVRDPNSLMPIDRLAPGSRAVIAARLGQVRLIDNAAIR